MRWVGVWFSVGLIVLVLYDAFEAMLLPRRVTRSIRFTRLFFKSFWRTWTFVTSFIEPPKRRAFALSIFGPISLPVLFGFWASGLIIGFAGLNAALCTPMNGLDESQSFADYCYFSGVTFFTLGYGDLSPARPIGRAISVAEAGLGFGFLAVVIGYLPVMYQAFSRREVTISLLDARAGSPPTASQLLIRLGEESHGEILQGYLAGWEVWSAELLESHLSFPVLPFFRSQHDNQSWLSALTMILDTSALVIAGLPEISPYQARLTFAMARHAAVDIAQVFHQRPKLEMPDRLDTAALRGLGESLTRAGVGWHVGVSTEATLIELRGLYEPFLQALADYLLLSLPPFTTSGTPVDNWQTSAWMRRASGIGKLARADTIDDHDD